MGCLSATLLLTLKLSCHRNEHQTTMSNSTSSYTRYTPLLGTLCTQVGFLEVSTVTVRRAALSCSLREVPARVEALFSTHAFEYGLLHRGFVATLPKASLVGGGRPEPGFTLQLRCFSLSPERSNSRQYSACQIHQEPAANRIVPCLIRSWMCSVWKTQRYHGTSTYRSIPIV